MPYPCQDLEHTTLLYELIGSPAAVKEQVQKVKKIATKHRGFGVAVSNNEEECHVMWRARKEALWSAGAEYPDKEAMITDVCVPLSKLPDLIERSKAEIIESSLPAPLVAHAGDGNFHAFIMFDPKNPEEVKEAKRLSSNMVHKALELHGTCTGEHGIGVGKMKYLEGKKGSYLQRGSFAYSIEIVYAITINLYIFRI